MVKLRRVSESELYLESKKDLDDLKAYLGDALFDDYMKIRDKISDPNFKDFSKLKKMDKKDVQDFVTSFQSKSDKKKADKKEGAEKIFENPDWVVYKITTYPAAQLYGKNTKWCITGRYPGHEDKGEGYFQDYINARHLDGGYYFFIDKHYSDRKYCVLRHRNGQIDSIWNAEDSELADADPMEAPMDLEEIADDLPDGMGEDLMDYLDSAGENFDPIDALIRELRKGPEEWDMERIKDYAYSVSDFGLDDLDEFYDALSDSRDITDNKLDAFTTLLEYGVPTEDWIRDCTLEDKCLTAFVDKLCEDPDTYGESYFDALLSLLINRYVFKISGGRDYTVLKSLSHISNILKNCSDNVIGESVSMLDILSTLPESITLNHAFLKLCFDKGSDVYSFIDDIRYMSDKSEGMKLLKAAVESKVVDLNGIYDEDDNETVFMEILSNLKPSVEDVKWMLTHGANPDTKDEDGDTAIAYTDDPKIQELLK